MSKWLFKQDKSDMTRFEAMRDSFWRLQHILERLNVPTSQFWSGIYDDDEFVKRMIEKGYADAKKT